LPDIQEESNTTINYRFQEAPPKIDFAIPKRSFSFQALVTWVKQALRRPDAEVAVYVTHTGKAFEMSARVTDYHGEVKYTAARQANDFDALLKQTALDVMRAFSPLISGTAKLAEVRKRCTASDTGCQAAV